MEINPNELIRQLEETSELLLLTKNIMESILEENQILNAEILAMKVGYPSGSNEDFSELF